MACTCTQLAAGAVGLTKAAAAMVGINAMEAEEVQQRRNQCRDCEHATRTSKTDQKFVDAKGLTNLSRCTKCSCFIKAKTLVSGEECPLGKWGKARPKPGEWAPLEHQSECAVITGCDTAHEKYLSIWRRYYEADNSYRVYFCDFGLSDSGRSIVRSWPNTVWVDCRDLPKTMHPWYRKSQGILRATTQHLLWVDLDTIISGNLADAFSPDGKVYVRDDHPGIRQKVPWMVQAGVIAFDHGDTLIAEWAKLCAIGDPVASVLDPSFTLRDQTILSAMLRNSPQRRGVLPERFNWTPTEFGRDADGTWIMCTPPEPCGLAVTHYCSERGKRQMDRLAATIADAETIRQRKRQCAGCPLARQHKGNRGFHADSQCIAADHPIRSFVWKRQALCPANRWGPTEVPMLDWSVKEPTGEGIITGCDRRQGWLIPVFMHYLRKTGCTLPVLFADFGMDAATRKLALQFGKVVESPHQMLHPMWQKIAVLMQTPWLYTAWLDLDILCSVDPRGMFDMEGKTLAVREGCKWYLRAHAVDNYHTGAVAFRHGDAILRQWASSCALGPEALPTIRDRDRIRDEELFSALARACNWYDQFHHMDSRWCSLADEPMVAGRNVHHTGPDGKRRIWQIAKRDGLVSGEMPDVSKT